MTKQEFLEEMLRDCFHYGHICEQMGLNGLSKSFSSIIGQCEDIRHYEWHKKEVEND